MKYVAAISTATAIKHKSRQSATAGTEPEPTPATMADTCEDGPGVDAFGDGFEWYDDVPTDCGWYDTETFSAHDACCACIGQSDPDVGAWDPCA